MGTRSTSKLPAPLDKVRRQLEQWRRKQKRPSRIPEDLWNPAVELARTYGLARTARSLRLDYYSLKNRLEATSAVDEKQTPDFIEVIPHGLAPMTECTVEFEDKDGARMRIHMKGGVMPDITALSESFWAGES